MNFRLLVSEILGTLFFVGKIPFASGTFGSLFGLYLWFLIKPNLKHPEFLLLILGTFFLGVGVSEILTQEWNNSDPKEIVIDELVGMWISLYLNPSDLKWAFISFILFRIFDIFKPGPVKIMDEMHDGIGVMMDDVVAGILALLTTQSLIFYFS